MIKLLADQQIRQFLADGYLRLESTVPPEVHDTIRVRIQQTVKADGNPGNNILPAIPEMRHIINSLEVQGALSSLLGPDYLEHPHRFCHVQYPVAEIDVGQQVAANSHQDSYTPLGRARSHLPRYLRLIYYPQDTPIELGPTHVIPGTQFNKTLTERECSRNVPIPGPAGAIFLTHFDVGHAAGVNLLDQPRYLVKFIFVRATSPGDGNGAISPWRTPATISGNDDLALAWSYGWDWLHGPRDRFASLRSGSLNFTHRDLSAMISDLADDRPADVQVAAAHQTAALGSQAAAAIPTLLRRLNTTPDPVRVAVLYALGAIGSEAIPELLQAMELAGEQRQEELQAAEWGKRALLMDDAAFALSAIGLPAVAPLIKALESPLDWVRLNAAFALGELDWLAKEAAPHLVGSLQDSSQLVVRTALDALGTVNGDPETVAPALAAMLELDKREWAVELDRQWTPLDQIHMNAANALARLGAGSAPAQEQLIRALDDPCRQVGAFATTALLRQSSPVARQTALEYLQALRWDCSITPERMF